MKFLKDGVQTVGRKHLGGGGGGGGGRGTSCDHGSYLLPRKPVLIRSALEFHAFVVTNYLNSG